MKIAIYGCSFAHEESAAFKKNPGKAWAKILREDYGYNVTNFAISGTSIYWSYLQFKKTHEEFDRIIFCETTPDRHYAPNMREWISQHSSPNTINSQVSKLEKNELEILKMYYMFIHNTQEKEDMAELMSKEIKFKRPDVLYIESFKILQQINRLDTFINEAFSKGFFMDPRYCHMNNVNNSILASKINDWLQGNSFKFQLEDFKPAEQEEINMWDDFYSNVKKGK